MRAVNFVACEKCGNEYDLYSDSGVKNNRKRMRKNND